MPEPAQIELEQDLDPKEKQDPKPAADKKTDETQYVKIDDLKKLSKQLDGLSSALRTSEKEKKELRSKLDDIEGRLSGRSIKPLEAQDELDKLLEQGEWRKPVATVARQAVEDALKARDQENSVRQSQAEKVRLLESSKKQVRDKYPDIDDPASETAKTYMKILNEKPHYLKSEYGPVLAMRDMEDTIESESPEPSQEDRRRLRANASSLRPGTPAKSQEVVLTREQKEFCKTAGMDEKIYLQTLKQMAGRSKELE